MLLAHLCSRGMELPGLAFLLVLTGGSVSVLQQEIDKFTLLWSRPQGKKEETLWIKPVRYREHRSNPS